MASYLSDTAIVLRVTDFSETSQVVGLFTRTHGLVPMIAKGAKRTTKKSASSGPLDLLTAGEVVFISASQNAELSTLSAWNLVDHRTTLRANLAGLNAAMVAAEITLRLVHPHDPHPDLYDELDATLQLLGAANRARALVAYAKCVLGAAGYAPQLDACAICGRSAAATSAETPLRFSARAGGILCDSCAAPGTDITIPVRIAVALSRLPAPQALRAKPPERPADPAALEQALQLLLSQVEAITDKALKTRYLLPSIFAASTT